jgi:SAM-dependent methyltransferase
MLQSIEGRRFLEVGCGAGDISQKLLKRGYTGVGIDFSASAIQQAATKLQPFITEGKYRLVEGDLFEKPDIKDDFDIVIGLLIMEHIQDALGFLKLLKSHARPGAHVVLSVPGRKDKWSLEDETTGHLRRYNSDELIEVVTRAGLVNPEVWSIAVPVSNILFFLSKIAVRFSQEAEKLELSQADQTKASGVREIPFKTVFPGFFKIILNRFTLWPLFAIQRFFFHTDLGLTMLVKAQYPKPRKRHHEGDNED